MPAPETPIDSGPHLRLHPGAEREQGLVPSAPFHQWPGPSGQPWTLFYRHPPGYLLRFPGLADFEVSAAGDDVTAYPAPGAAAQTLQHLYLNQVLPLALSRQGRLVLHAGAVDIAGQGAAFVGLSGRGKSTLTASFATTGTGFLTDDGLLLAWHEGQCWAQPSHASIRLWPDSREALTASSTDIVSVASDEKARLLAGPELPHCGQARPLSRLYVLGDGSSTEVRIRPLRPSQALAALVQHAFLLDVQQPSVLSWQFEEVARLAELPIHFELDYPRDYAALPDVRAAIASHMATATFTA